MRKALIGCLVFYLGTPAHADTLVPDGLGGFKVYDDRGRLQEHIVPNDATGDFDIRDTRGRRMGTIAQEFGRFLEDLSDGPADSQEDMWYSPEED